MKFKDTTNTNSNTWRHKNLDYQGLYHQNDDSDEDDYKSFYLGKLQKGDIVFREKNGYRNALVISDIDESGNIIASSIIKNSSKAYYNGNMVNEVVNPSTISAIGYNIYDNEDLHCIVSQ